MASYQDLDVRVAVLEDQVLFMLKSFSFQQKTAIAGPDGREVLVQKTLLDIYREAKAVGAEIENASKASSLIQTVTGTEDNG